MGKIHVLESDISNKIAAGEVVERPSSVIKELVENSIDAGASVISVEIKKGGVVYMRVTDNGTGMSHEDAKICFLRHATSKIQTGEDLEAIYTLGFRGEALSSIGAVSKVKLSTKRAEDSEGICVTCEGGEIKTFEDTGTPDGTSITVENLFYNTPARLKFLKRDATEAGYITEIITKFILAHPEISFKLIIDGKEKLFSAGDSSLQNAVYTVYGKDYAKAVLAVENEYENITISGVIGKGNVSRPNRNYQSFFVNGRYIKSPLIIRAVEEAYKNQIMIGKFPMAAINLEINPQLIDINVHPTKLEVKFSNEKDIYHAVYYAVKNALYALPNVPKIERSSEFSKDTAKEQLTVSDMVSSLNKSMESAESIAGITKRPPSPNYNPRENPFLKKEDTDTKHIEMLKQKYSAVLDAPIRTALSDSGRELPPKPEVEPEISKAMPEPPKNEAETEFSENVFIDEYFEVVGQIFDTYIIVEKNGEMMIVDQHAAHERLKYEELLRTLDQNSIYSQILLEPEVVKLTGSEFGIYCENKEIIDKLGFETEEFGDDSIIVRSVPSDVEAGDVETLIIDMISQAGQSKKDLITDRNQRLLYTIACKAAVKANRKMSVPEMETLVRDVLRLKNINTCPHGRPIIITMSKKEIEKEFKRIT